MAGRGPTPKPDASRRRRNVATSAAVLPSAAEMRSRFRGRRGTKLPKHLLLPARPDNLPWTAHAIAWWQEAVTSSMGTQYLDADMHGLYLVFALIDEFYRELAEPVATRGRIGRLSMLSVEIRQQIARYGLTPRDRLALHWSIAADDEEATGPDAGGGGTRGNVTDFRSALGEAG